MNTTVTDPVCGMTIDPAEAAGSSTYEGEIYHFCARACQAKFDETPTLYVTQAAPCCFPASTIACCATQESCC